MGVSVKACTLPGSARSSAFDPSTGCTTLTDRIVASSVVIARWLLAGGAQVKSVGYCQQQNNSPQPRRPRGEADRVFGWRIRVRAQPYARERSARAAPSALPVICVLSSDSVSVLMRIPPLGVSSAAPARSFPIRESAQRRGDEKKRGDGGAKQSADDRAAERRILLAPVAKAESHRHHADDHGQSGHDDGTKARGACFNSRLNRIAVLGDDL